MFEQLDDRERAPQVSGAMTLGILAAYLVGAFGGLCIFIVLADRAFGFKSRVQSFTRTLLSGTSFSLHEGDPSSTACMTRGFSIEFRFCGDPLRVPDLIFAGEAVWFSMKPHLPGYWFTEHGKPVGPLYVFVVIGSVTVVFFIEVLISRRILSRSLREGTR